MQPESLFDNELLPFPGLLLSKLNRERILRNLAEKKAAARAESSTSVPMETIENIVFSKGENVERSTRDHMTSIDNINNNPDKKKKKKKNKNK